MQNITRQNNFIIPNFFTALPENRNFIREPGWKTEIVNPLSHPPNYIIVGGNTWMNNLARKGFCNNTMGNLHDSCIGGNFIFGSCFQPSDNDSFSTYYSIFVNGFNVFNKI